MIDGETRGKRIVIEGRVLDGGDAPIDDCMVEIWQADAAGLLPGSPGETRGRRRSCIFPDGAGVRLAGG